MARKYKKRAKGIDRTPYATYLRHRKKLEEQGYKLSPAFEKEDITTIIEYTDDKGKIIQRPKVIHGLDYYYEQAKRKGEKNFFRNLTNYERVFTKRQYKRFKKSLEQEVDRETKAGKEFYEEFKDKTWEDFQTFSKEQWKSFRDNFISNGGTWEAFRGLYENETKKA